MDFLKYNTCANIEYSCFGVHPCAPSDKRKNGGICKSAQKEGWFCIMSTHFIVHKWNIPSNSNTLERNSKSCTIPSIFSASLYTAINPPPFPLVAVMHEHKMLYMNYIESQ